MKIYDFNGKANLAGPQIRYYRKKAKWTQEQLAAKLQVEGLSLEQKYISRIEKQERFLADFELYLIARVLSVPVDDLLNPKEKDS